MAIHGSLGEILAHAGGAQEMRNIIPAPSRRGPATARMNLHNNHEGQRASKPVQAFVNGKIYVMDQPDTVLEAILMDSRIIAVGGTEKIRQMANEQGAPITDLEGKVMIPGFVDAHTHFLHVGVTRTRPDLRNCKSMNEALQVVRQWVQEHPGPTIGEGFDEGSWPEGRWPTKAELDAATTVDGTIQPFVFRRICGHIAIANTAALGPIWAHWPREDIVNCETGVILEEASLYLNEVVPSTPAQLDSAVIAACHRSHELGVTAVGDYSQAPYRAALQRAAATGTLTVRTSSSIYVQQLDQEILLGMRTGRRAAHASNTETWSAMPASAWTEEHEGVIPWPRDQGDSDFLRDGGLKVFLDGSLGARTALLRDDYSDEPGNNGKRNWSDEEVRTFFQTAHRAGIQIHAHAIGDGAIDQGIEAFATLEAMEEHACQRMRHRFEHFEIVHDDQIERCAALQIVASSQPNFVGVWSAPGGMYHERLGDRCPVNNRFVSFKKANVPLAFGSDGMPFGPLVGLEAAINHPEPDQRLTIAEAVWHYTQQAAWSLHWHSVGELSPGCHADFLILNQTNLDNPLDWTFQTFVAGQLTAASAAKQAP